MNIIYCSISKSGTFRSICLTLALCCALITPTALADDGNCGNGQGTGNGCVTSVQGLPGPQGPAGPTGPQGPKGDTGAVGAQGPAGPQGAKGETGAIGPQGPAGPQGAKGETGAIGLQGPAGPQGPKGDTGAVGAQGPVGPQGAKGETGAMGLQGPAGPQGAKGDTGPQGPAGPTGAVGPQGAQGLTGPMGLQGPRGDKGDKGDKGDQGEPGLPGSVTFMTQVYSGSGQTSDNTHQTIPGGSLMAPVPVVQLNLESGDFVLNANVDVAPTMPIAQQYTCLMKVTNEVDPVDSLPIIYGVQTRLTLGGTVHLNTPSQVTVSCGSDAPARLLKVRLNALHVDRINSVIRGI